MSFFCFVSFWYAERRWQFEHSMEAILRQGEEGTECLALLNAETRGCFAAPHSWGPLGARWGAQLQPVTVPRGWAQPKLRWCPSWEDVKEADNVF